MAELIKNEGQSIGMLAANVLKDTEKLVRQEMDLFKAQLNAELKEILVASVNLAIGWLFLIAGALLFAMTLVHLLSGEAHLPFWAAYGITTALFLITGAAFILFRGNNNGNENKTT